MNEDSIGMFGGSATEAEDASDKIVVYAYDNGSFNAATEIEGKGGRNGAFAHEVTSSRVASTYCSGSLNVLPESD